MRIYFDTEFTSLESMINQDMTAAGFVTEDGRLRVGEFDAGMQS